MKKICPVCKGKGSKLRINWGLAMMSLGLTALIELGCADHPRYRCKFCDGKGFYDRVEV